MNEQQMMTGDFCFEAVIFDMDGTVIDRINADFFSMAKIVWRLWKNAFIR